jgi:hypothetical protein
MCNKCSLIWHRTPTASALQSLAVNSIEFPITKISQSVGGRATCSSYRERSAGAPDERHTMFRGHARSNSPPCPTPAAARGAATAVVPEICNSRHAGPARPTKGTKPNIGNSCGTGSGGIRGSFEQQLESRYRLSTLVPRCGCPFEPIVGSVCESRAALAAAFFTPSRCPAPPLASPPAALLPPLHAPASPHALASGTHPSLSLSAHDHASKALSSRRVLFHSPPESSLTPHPRIFILPSHERSRRRFYQRRNRKAEFWHQRPV